MATEKDLVFWRETGFRAGRYKQAVKLFRYGDRVFMAFGFNKILLEEVKSMEGARWHGHAEADPPNLKMWSVPITTRNIFALQYLEGLNPYAPYQSGLVDYTPRRNVFAHQLTMIRHALTRHYCIFACEMGTGKTLAAIETMEASGYADSDIWYVGPKSGVVAVDRELRKWSATVHPFMFTYEGLVKHMTNWQDGAPAPKFVVFDECSKIKTPTSQRSKAAFQLADSIRLEHGDSGYVILMSGTPAPRTPVDWWHQCEVARPGFLKEGNVAKLRNRLAIMKQQESAIGQAYQQIVSWLDDDRKCAVCGMYEDDPIHGMDLMLDGLGHAFVKSKNEVSYLYERMKGLVLVQFKKDCLDLPEKQYRKIELKPTPDTLRTMKTIAQTASRAIEALTLLRELSDGFQYVAVEGDLVTCDACAGTGRVNTLMPDEARSPMEPLAIKRSDHTEQMIICDACGGTGQRRRMSRAVEEVATPKDDAYIELLEDHEDVGRFIAWGGFEGTIDRLIKIALEKNWYVLCVDGRGYRAFSPDTLECPSAAVLLDAMDGSHPDKAKLSEKYPKVCFVGHPQAGGMALTLTAAPTMLFYSNSFSGEARMQAEDRFHRAGMDTNRGATVVDLIHLKTDALVLENLRKKRELQVLTMGELKEAIQ